jgi:transcriptional regulator with XRE-family HTH domain
MNDLDKAAMGRRIRQIRSQAGLRQWELARLLGTTQSAVHKYEHGVVPEPRRLMELARIGGTSIEWILSGRHWENGSEERERPTPDLLRTAALLREIEPDMRPSVEEALMILREAVSALTSPEAGDRLPDPAIVADLKHHAEATTRVLEAAWEIQNAVLRRVSRAVVERLSSSPLVAPRGAPTDRGNSPAPPRDPSD